ncbi:sugar/nucleoside kinase (ribokinase family) [Defluviimonas denitrificans]|jgi:sugar/nucleoside kinase (ribokinase family)|uniref:Sugar/nucleoside kinase (Ribokinase family) n=1 Tax=Albidovulum denitrificans TaxID=404881 RepID=A0A2S8S5E1_9RHOB|nr:PfkB family carbohydrate kinase [Defluviimonas denitrificans]PQV56003.1 sugar/nucleoside kinase (ribokinase family) [Defluviimonas denitrificans]
MTPRLVQLSGVIVDHIYWVEAVPRAGEEAIVRRAVLCAGGGYNAMVAARRAGMAVAYAGTLGTGPFADIVAAALADEGIDTLRERLSGQDQGCCTCLIDRAGERTFVAASGADGIVTAADLAALMPGAGDWCLLSGYALGYRDSRAALTEWLEARAGKIDLVFDPSPLVAQIPDRSRDAALSATTWVSANRAEAMALTGCADPEAAAATLANRPGGAIVRDGANGCFLATADSPPRHIPGHPVRAVDTNGAGDTHIGAFIATLAETGDPFRAARFANIAAALSTTQEGPSTAPTKADVLSVLAQANEPARTA